MKEQTHDTIPLLLDLGEPLEHCCEEKGNLDEETDPKGGHMLVHRAELGI